MKRLNTLELITRKTESVKIEQVEDGSINLYVTDDKENMTDIHLFNDEAIEFIYALSRLVEI